MFRSRFLLTAAVAVATALLAPAVSQAGFSVTFSTSDNATVWVANDNNSPNGAGPFDDRSAATNRIRAGTNAEMDAGNGTILFNDLQIDVTTVTNNPGTITTGEVFTTELFIKNTGSTTITRNVRIEITSTGFTDPGVTGGFLSLQTILTNLMGLPASSLGSGAGQNQIFSFVTDGPGGSQSPDPAQTDPNSFVLQPSGQWHSNVVQFQRGGTYDLSLVFDLTLTLDAGAEVNIDATGVVAAPAPAGLVMLASALPVVGLLGLRRRLVKPEATTAA